jgi:hypothetical protein
MVGSLPPPSSPGKAIVTAAGLEQVMSSKRSAATGKDPFNTWIVTEPGPQVLAFTLRQTLPMGLGSMTTNTHFAKAKATLKADHSYTLESTIAIDRTKSIWNHPIPTRQTVTYKLMDKSTGQVMATAVGQLDPGFLFRDPDLIGLLQANMPANSR